MKNINTYLILIGLTVFTLSCQDKQTQIKEEIIKIKGSDSELLMTQSLVDVYTENSKNEVVLEGGGTATGIEALINHQADIATCSRKWTADEIELAEQNGVDPVYAIVAIDAIALISHPKNPVDSLSTIQIKGIFSGEINNWSQLGGVDAPIHLYGRNDQSGTYTFLENRFVREEGFTESMVEKETNHEILEAVKNDTLGIGYVATNFVMDANGKPNGDVWAMYIYTEGDRAAYSPYQSTEVVNGNYSLVRPLYQYFDGLPHGKSLEFIEMVLSEQGQDIIRSTGFYPITSDLESKNISNGF